MASEFERTFLDFSARKLRQLTARIRECAGKLNDEQIWWRAGEEQNAVGNLLLHLAGNIRQWIVAGMGGKPDIRVREREFSSRGQVTGLELADNLDQVVEEAVAVLQNLPAERLRERIVVQKFDLTVLEGIYHVVEHFAQHTGQIIYATKLLTGKSPAFYRYLEGGGPHKERTP
jgi:uncharacterized damage-inducible protein DinB